MGVGRVESSVPVAAAVETGEVRATSLEAERKPQVVRKAVGLGVGVELGVEVQKVRAGVVVARSPGAPAGRGLPRSSVMSLTRWVMGMGAGEGGE